MDADLSIRQVISIRGPKDLTIYALQVIVY